MHVPDGRMFPGDQEESGRRRGPKKHKRRYPSSAGIATSRSGSRGRYGSVERATDADATDQGASLLADCPTRKKHFRQSAAHAGVFLPLSYSLSRNVPRPPFPRLPARLRATVEGSGQRVIKRERDKRDL